MYGAAPRLTPDPAFFRDNKIILGPDFSQNNQKYIFEKLGK
jgi:hypothetical protein